MIPLVTCPYCTRMIKLRRRNCNRNFVHSECGATILVPKVNELRKGSSLVLVSPPENSFEGAGEPLPESSEPGMLPRELRDISKNQQAPGSQADLAELAARLQELTGELTEVVARLRDITGSPSARQGNSAGADAENANVHGTEQSAHAVLVKGRADKATLKEAYRLLDDVDELRLDNENALALQQQQREEAREKIIGSAAPWEVDEAGSNPGSGDSRIPWKLVISSAAVLFIGGFSAAILSRPDQTEPPQQTQSYEEILSEIAAAPGGAEKIALINANIDTVKQGVNKAAVTAFLNDYLTAETWQDRLAFVRKSEHVKPLMEHYYSDHALRRGTVKDVQRVAFTQIGSLALVDVSATDNSDAQISAALEIIDGKFYLDWESFTAYSGIALADFLTRAPGSTALFRVKAEPSFYFNYSFSRDSNVALRIEEPFTETACYGYIAQGSELQKKLTNMVIEQQGASDRIVRPLLRLRIPTEDHGNNQVWIEAIESDSWVTP